MTSATQILSEKGQHPANPYHLLFIDLLNRLQNRLVILSSSSELSVTRYGFYSFGAKVGRWLKVLRGSGTMSLRPGEGRE